MSDAPEPETPPPGPPAAGTPRPEVPPELRFLKRLVTTLTVVMIAGLVTIVGLLVIRLGAPAPAPPAVPANIALPEGAQVAAVTLARDWLVVVTEAGEILLFDRHAGGSPVSRVVPD